MIETPPLDRAAQEESPRKDILLMFSERLAHPEQQLASVLSRLAIHLRWQTNSYDHLISCLRALIPA